MVNFRHSRHSYGEFRVELGNNDGYGHTTCHVPPNSNALVEKHVCVSWPGTRSIRQKTLMGDEGGELSKADSSRVSK